MKVEKIIERYGLTSKDFNNVFSLLKERIIQIGIDVVEKDLSHVVETALYGLDPKETDNHAETAITDGQKVYLHKENTPKRSVSIVYDLLHIVFGHIWQWGASNDSVFEFYGDKAYNIGVVFHLGASEEKLQEVFLYEKEASVIALTFLEEIILNDPKKEQLMHFFNDYAQTDLWYIIDYYRNKKVLNFFDHWKFDTEKLPKIDIPSLESVTFTRRDTPAVPLISN